jgi:hypothetical protein
MDCRDCARYCLETNKCKDKKLNPQTYSEAVEISGVYGLRVICMFCDHRERLLQGRALQIPSPKPSKTVSARSRKQSR